MGKITALEVTTTKKKDYLANLVNTLIKIVESDGVSIIDIIPTINENRVFSEWFKRLGFAEKAAFVLSALANPKDYTIKLLDHDNNEITVCFEKDKNAKVDKKVVYHLKGGEEVEYNDNGSEKRKYTYDKLLVKYVRQY